MFFIYSQLCHQSCQIFKVGFFSLQNSYLPVFAEVMNPCGTMHQHSCCVLSSWGAVSAFLQSPWASTYATFHKVIKNHRSPKNVKSTKFHPNIAPGLCPGSDSCCLLPSILWPQEKYLCFICKWRMQHLSWIRLFYCLYEDNPLGNRISAELDWWPSQRHLLRREKKGLQVLVGNYWQSFCEMLTQYWINTEHGTWYICFLEFCGKVAYLLQITWCITWVLVIMGAYYWPKHMEVLFKLCSLTG